MKLEIRNDSVVIEGYVNAIERNSKPLMSRIGQFIERICKGAFKKAIERNNDIKILLNHDWNKIIGGTEEGTLELEEDNIGLKARATITDTEVIKKARNGDLVGWSFGFSDIEVDNSMEKGMPLREVKDLNLYEVSILDRTKTPAYDGTLVYARSINDEEVTIYRAENTESEVEIIDNTKKEEPTVSNTEGSFIMDKKIEETEPKQQPIQEVEKNISEKIDYSIFDDAIKSMKEDKQ